MRSFQTKLLVKKVAVLLGLAAVFVSCSALSYRFYGLKADSYEGTLLGPKPGDDIPFRVCTPNAQSKSPCIVLQQDEFFRMYQELLSARQALKDCQTPKGIQ